MSEIPVKARKKSSMSLRQYMFILLALLILGGGAWLGWQYLHKGEIIVTLPDMVAKNVNLGEEGKLGPLRIKTEQESALPTVEPDAGDLGTETQNNTPDIDEENDELLEPLPPPSSLEDAQIVTAKVPSGSDSVVTLDFINDLAALLVRNYWPAGSHPGAIGYDFSTANIKGIIQYYGIDLTGLKGSRRGDIISYNHERALIINYVFMPAMLEALTQLYADRFIDRLVLETEKELLDAEGNPRLLARQDAINMLGHYAIQARSLGAALTAYADTPDAAALIMSYRQAVENTYAAHDQLLDAQYQLELAREQDDKSHLHAASLELQRKGKIYRKTLLEQQSRAEAIQNFMSVGLARNIDNDSLIYIAGWAARRGPKAGPALKAAAGCLVQLAGKMDEKKQNLQENE